jgi:hypothetical protein
MAGHFSQPRQSRTVIWELLHNQSVVNCSCGRPPPYFATAEHPSAGMSPINKPDAFPWRRVFICSVWLGEQTKEKPAARAGSCGWEISAGEHVVIMRWAGGGSGNVFITNRFLWKRLETDMTTFMWIMVVAGGPVILGCAIAYAMLRSRRLTPDEEHKRDDAIKDMYHKPH